MGKSLPKTNAARALDRMRLAYRLQPYEVGDEHLAAHQVAAQIGMAPEAVFKTLLAHGDRHGHCFAVVPATSDIDLKALATESDNRKVTLVPLKEVQSLTGYVRGGVTALAAKKRLAVFLDHSALDQTEIAVSAGQRGLQLVLAPEDYIRATEAKTAPITVPRSESE